VIRSSATKIVPIGSSLPWTRAGMVSLRYLLLGSFTLRIREVMGIQEVDHTQVLHVAL